MSSTLLKPILSQLDSSQDVAVQIQIGVIAGLLVLGSFSLASTTASLFRFAWRHFIRPGKKMTKYGAWAIVTGATDGIGRQYCNALAEKGMNIYLISRTEAKLQAAATEVASKYGVETKYYAADLAAAGAETMDSSCWYGLKSNISGMDIGVLINNAGMSYDYPEYLHQLDAAVVENICALNNSSMVKMAYTVLPGMVQNGRGAIVNLTSLTATSLPSCPLLSAYAASKAFVEMFSKSLATEYGGTGIDVQAQSPGFVATKMSKIRRTSLTVPSPAAFARAAVRHIGYEPLSVPWPAHAIEGALYENLPIGIANFATKGMMMKMREKALKKKAKAAKAE